MVFSYWITEFRTIIPEKSKTNEVTLWWPSWPAGGKFQATVQGGWSQTNNLAILLSWRARSQSLEGTIAQLPGWQKLKMMTTFSIDKTMGKQVATCTLVERQTGKTLQEENLTIYYRTTYVHNFGTSNPTSRNLPWRYTFNDKKYEHIY